MYLNGALNNGSISNIFYQRIVPSRLIRWKHSMNVCTDFIFSLTILGSLKPKPNLSFLWIQHDKTIDKPKRQLVSEQKDQLYRA